MNHVCVQVREGLRRLTNNIYRIPRCLTIKVSLMTVMNDHLTYETQSKQTRKRFLIKRNSSLRNASHFWPIFHSPAAPSSSSTAQLMWKVKVISNSKRKLFTTNSLQHNRHLNISLVLHISAVSKNISSTARRRAVVKQFVQAQKFM